MRACVRGCLCSWVAARLVASLPAWPAGAWLDVDDVACFNLILVSGCRLRLLTAVRPAALAAVLGQLRGEGPFNGNDEEGGEKLFLLRVVLLLVCLLGCSRLRGSVVRLKPIVWLQPVIVEPLAARIVHDMARGHTLPASFCHEVHLAAAVPPHGTTIFGCPNAPMLFFSL